jgi:hypothetical protein
MACERCKDPNNLDVHQYTITKSTVAGGEEKQERNLCDSCAATTKDAGFKLTGGKREAEPEASTESRDEVPAPNREDVPSEEASEESEPPKRRR